MKHTGIAALIIFIAVICSTCSMQDQVSDESSVPSSQITQSDNSQITSTSDERIDSEPVMSEIEETESAPDKQPESGEPEVKERKISLKINDRELSVTLYNNPLADQLYDMLPLTVTFEDYNQTEKIGYFPDGGSLNTDNAENGFEPSAGDLCYYAPWKNLSVFYKGFRYSEDLYSIGHIDNGIDTISELETDFVIVFDKE